MLGLEERLEAFAATAGGAELLAETLGVTLGFRMGLPGTAHGLVGETEHHAPHQPQHKSRIGMANQA
jgi:hypothetical protein